MSHPEVSRSSLSLEEFIALNDEVVALVRAGVPLEQGLLELSGDMPGRLGHIARDIGTRIQAGESLGQILTAKDSAYPPLWRAVVGAGLRTGQLAAALEGISTTARRMADMQRGIRAAMVYPWVITTIAFGSFVLLVTQLAPRMSATYRALTSSHDPLLDTLVSIGQSVHWWGTLIPAVAVIYLLASSWQSQRTYPLASNRFSISAWHWWPGTRRTVQNSRMATFAETLGLLLDYKIPLGEALLLAGDASGDRRLSGVSRMIADRLQRGEIISAREAQAHGFPPLLAWLLTSHGTSGKHPNLVAALVKVAERSRQAASREALQTVTFLPIAVTAVVGGLVTLVEGVALFWPISRLLYDLGRFS